MWSRPSHVVVRRLDTLVVRSVPHVQKESGGTRPSTAWRAGAGSCASTASRSTSVKVTFLRGASLRPLPPVGSKDKHTRYFHVHEGDQIDEELVTSWVRQASELPGWIP